MPCLRICINLLLVVVAITAEDEGGHQSTNAYSESHGKLDNLIHATSHKALEAQAAGQALKELEHNIGSYIAWSTHSTVAGVQTMPISTHSFYDLQQTVAAIGRSIATISNGVGDENAMIQERSREQTSKLAGLHDDLNNLKSALEALYQTSQSYWNERPAPDNVMSSVWIVSYAAPRLSRSDPVNRMVLVVLEVVLIGIPVYLWLGRRLNPTSDKQPPAWTYGLA